MPPANCLPAEVKVDFGRRKMSPSFHSTELLFSLRQSQQIPASLSVPWKVQRAIAAQFNFNKQLNRNKNAGRGRFSRGCKGIPGGKITKRGLERDEFHLTLIYSNNYNAT